MKKILLVGILMLCGVSAQAYDNVIEVIHDSSATVGGVRVTTGTAIQVDLFAFNGVMGDRWNRAGVRIQNMDGTFSVWCGYESRVSSRTAAGDDISNTGLQLAPGTPGGSAPFNSSKTIKHFCITEDGAGTDGALISIEQFGYR